MVRAWQRLSLTEFRYRQSAILQVHVIYGLVAGVFKDRRIRRPAQVAGDLDGLGVEARISERHLIDQRFHRVTLTVRHLGDTDTLRHRGRVRVREAAHVGVFAQVGGLDDQGITLPVAYRVTHAGVQHRVGARVAFEVDLAILVVTFPE